MKKIVLILSLVASLVYAKKIVVLEPSVVEMMYLLEADDQIAAISTLTMAKIWPEDKTVNLPSVGTYSKPNLEKIMELGPDLVVTSFHSQGVNADLAKFGIKTLVIKSDSLEDIYKNINLIAKETGKEEKAKELITQTKTKVAEFANSGYQGKKVAILFSSTPIMAFNDNSLVGDIFAKLGFVNIASGMSGQTPIISPEILLSANPDYIIVVGGMGGSESEILAQNPTLKKINAAKNGKIITIPSSLLLRGTPRISENIEAIEKMLK